MDEVPTIEFGPEVPTIDWVPEVPTMDEVPTIERAETLLASNIPPAVGWIPTASITCPGSTLTYCGSAIAGVKSTPNSSTFALPRACWTERTFALTKTVVGQPTRPLFSRLLGPTGPPG